NGPVTNVVSLLMVNLPRGFFTAGASDLSCPTTSAVVSNAAMTPRSRKTRMLHPLIQSTKQRSLDQRRQRHPHHQIISRRRVIEAAAAVVDAVLADAVEEIARVDGAIDQRLAVEEVVRNPRHVLRGEGRELLRIFAVFALIERQREG